MNAVEVLMAVLEMGLPLAAISWLFFTFLYSSGEIDRSADRRAVAARMREMKQSYRSSRAVRRRNPVMAKWMRFGGGFYGLAALWTFIVIELGQFFGFMFNNPGVGSMLQDGLVSFLIEALINQLENFVMALVWFSYWPADSTVVWVAVAYLGYWAGMELARRQQESPLLRLVGRFSHHPLAQRVVHRLQQNLQADAGNEEN